MNLMSFLKACPKIILAPLILIGAAAVSLYLLGLVQDYLRPPEHGPREYASIEAAEANLGFRISVPAYFPGYIAWPPARITGRLLPVPGVETVYNSPYGARIMVISQVASDGGARPDRLPWVKTVLAEDPLKIDGITGVIIVARDADGHILNGASWNSGSFFYAVITDRSKSELLTIISSM